MFSLLLFMTLFTTSKSFDGNLINSIIQASHECRKNRNTALAVSVVKDGRTLLSHGYGVTDINSDIPVTSSTKFNVASLTKAFTAALLVKVMKERARLNLSTPVWEIIGPHFHFNDDLRTKQATVEDILSHKMAIPANNRIRFDTNLTRKTVIQRVAYIKSFDTFRTTFIYNNIMYGLASSITEIVGRGRWENLLRRHILQPLKMMESTFTTEADMNANNIAKPVTTYEGKLEQISTSLNRKWGELTGSGSFMSTANDMASWMNFHLSGGYNGEGLAVMSTTDVEDLHRPRTAMPSSSMSLFQQPDIPVTMSFDIYAMGWWTGYYRGYPIIGHSGSSYGYRTILVLMKSIKAGVFIVMNGDDYQYAYRGTLLSLMFDNLLKVTPWVDTNTLCTFPKPYHNITKRRTPPKESLYPLAHKITAYIGVYHNPAYGNLRILQVRHVTQTNNKKYSFRNKKLAMELGYGRWDLTLRKAKHTILNIKVKSRADFPEYFYAIGKGITNLIDLGPFIFHPPPDGSNVIDKISAQGFESRLPPVFLRMKDSRSHGLQGASSVRLAVSRGQQWVKYLLLTVVVMLTTGSEFYFMFVMAMLNIFIIF